MTKTKTLFQVFRYLIKTQVFVIFEIGTPMSFCERFCSRKEGYRLIYIYGYLNVAFATRSG